MHQLEPNCLPFRVESNQSALLSGARAGILLGNHLLHFELTFESEQLELEAGERLHAIARTRALISAKRGQ